MDNRITMITSKKIRILSTLCLAATLLANQAFAAEALQFAPHPAISRAEFVRSMVDTFYTPEKIKECFAKLSPSRYTLLFTDVSIHEDYAGELCVAMRAGIIAGYGDGSFRPNRPVNFAEASKIITRSLHIVSTSNLPSGMPWFAQYVRSLEHRSAIPRTITAFDHPMTLADLDEILNRLHENIADRPSVGYDELQRRTQQKYRKA